MDSDEPLLKKQHLSSRDENYMRRMQHEIILVKENVQRIEVEAREANTTLITLLDKIQRNVL
jgi:hypothetical protein